MCASALTNVKRMSHRYIAKKLLYGEFVRLDGAIGTELERRGVPMDADAWCGPSVAEHGDVLRDIHKEYLNLGCDIITANTYASVPGMLRAAGQEQNHSFLIERAVAIAREAAVECGREETSAVAGSMSHMLPHMTGTDMVDPTLGDVPPGFEEDCAKHASALLEAGVDMILLEMMFNPARAAIATNAACATGLPVWFGLSVREGAHGGPILYDKHAERSVSEIFKLIDDRVEAVGIMHSRADLIEPAFKEIRAYWSGPMAVYPDSGHFEMPNWNFNDVMAPSVFAEFAQHWRDLGFIAIGGCCGLGPSHIELLPAGTATA
jgi:S-methylmethionine-dependent homocysteine/selenocysteine methylase